MEQFKPSWLIIVIMHFNPKQAWQEILVIYIEREMSIYVDTAVTSRVAQPH